MSFPRLRNFDHGGIKVGWRHVVKCGIAEFRCIMSYGIERIAQSMPFTLCISSFFASDSMGD